MRCPTRLHLGFGSTLDQLIEDESWGIDNVQIMDNVNAYPQVPAPSTSMLFGIGMVYLGATNNRIKKRNN